MIPGTDEHELVLEDSLGDEFGMEQFANQGDLHLVVQDKFEHLV